MIYVSNFNSDSISVFAAHAHTNAAQVRRIAGARTRLSGPIALAVDAQGKLYVANRRSAAVTVYPPAADGDVAPLRVLLAPAMHGPAALAIGPSGDAFVSNVPNGVASRSAAIFHFGSDAGQTDYAITGSRTGLTYPVGLAFDDDGALVVANAFGGVVSAFAPGANGNAPPLRSFTAATTSTQGMACGARMLLSGSCVCLYAAGAGGGAKPAAVFGRTPRLPLCSPGGIAIDARVAPPTVCVADFAACAVYVIRTTGSAPNLGVASVNSIAGPTTGLDGPIGVVVAE